jgi:hypothetical protein
MLRSKKPHAPRFTCHWTAVCTGFVRPQIWRKAIGESAGQKELIRRIKAEYFLQPDGADLPEYSHRDGITKAYALTPQTRAAIEAMDKKASKTINESIVSQITDGHRQPVRKYIAVIDKRTSQGATLHGSRCTLVTSQLTVHQWHKAIGDPTLADAILDRLIHHPHRLDLDGKSMRSWTRRNHKPPSKLITRGAKLTLRALRITGDHLWPD